MDKLNRLLAATPPEFMAAFDAVEPRTRTAQTTAAFWMEGGTTCAGGGFAWGQGEISYQGRNHAFRLSSLSVTDSDATGICANGSVMHLRQLSDFAGKYSPSAAGSLEAGDDTVAYLKNERGVVMKLTATDASWRVNLMVNGLRVRLKHSK